MDWTSYAFRFKRKRRYALIQSREAPEKLILVT